MQKSQTHKNEVSISTNLIIMDIDFQHFCHLAMFEDDGSLSSLVIHRTVCRHILRSPTNGHFTIGSVRSLYWNQSFPRTFFEQ